MAFEVEVFRTDDYVEDSSIPLAELLLEAFEPEFGEPLDDCFFEVHLIAVADRRALPGPPVLVNLRPDHGYANVRITRGGTVLYSHPHAIRDLVGRPLQRMISRRVASQARPEADDPGAGVPKRYDDEHWGYRIQGPGLEHLPLVRPAPHIAGGFTVRSNSARSSILTMEEVADPEPPAERLGNLGVAGDDTAADAPILVVLAQDVADGLRRTIRFSDEVEEGGFLIGRVYRDADHPGRTLVRVTASVPAERTGASMLHLTFTGESFLRIGERLSAGRDGDRLVGWYHTHLFPATGGLGLSSIDVDLHTMTFTRPWQIAALVNLDHDHRVLRIYRSHAGGMARAPFRTASP